MSYPQPVEAMLERWRVAAGGIAEALAGRGDWTAARSTYDDALVDMLDVPSGTRVTSGRIGGVPCETVTAGGGEGRAMLYLHGGGYCSGSARIYRGLAARFAARLRMSVHLVDYRLAPEHPYPAALDDAVAAYRALVADCAPTRLILAGDSAGGAMVVSTMRRARDAGLPLPAGGIAISPWADLSHRGRSMADRVGVDPLVRPAFLEALAASYLGDRPRTDPDASPVYADVRGLPPMLIQVGEREVMLSDALRLAAHLAESRVRVTTEVWPGMFHVWPLFAGHLAAADDAVSSAAAFVETLLTTKEYRS